MSAEQPSCCFGVWQLNEGIIVLGFLNISILIAQIGIAFGVPSSSQALSHVESSLTGLGAASAVFLFFALLAAGCQILAAWNRIACLLIPALIFRVLYVSFLLASLITLTILINDEHYVKSTVDIEVDSFAVIGLLGTFTAVAIISLPFEVYFVYVLIQGIKMYSAEPMIRIMES